MMPPSKRDDGDTRVPALACTGLRGRARGCALGRVRWWLFYRGSCWSARSFSKSFFFLAKASSQ